MSTGRMQWITKVLREKYRDGQLSDEQIARLNAIGFDFKGRYERLREEREPLLEFVKCNPGIYSCPELAQKFGMTRDKCYNLLFNHGLIDLVKPSRRYISENEVVNILSDYDDGMLRKDICRKYCMSDSALKNILKKNQRHRQRQVNQSIRDEILKLRKMGKTRQEIALSVGFKPSTISRILKEEGMPFANRHITDGERERVGELLDKKMTYKEIAEETGLGVSLVGAMARRADKGRGLTYGRKSVLCIETGCVYSSTMAAQRSVNPNSVNGSCVVRACKTGRAYHGFHWKYIEDEAEDGGEEYP